MARVSKLYIKAGQTTPSSATILVDALSGCVQIRRGSVVVVVVEEEEEEVVVVVV